MPKFLFRVTLLLSSFSGVALAVAGEEPALIGTEFVMPSRNVSCRAQDYHIVDGVEQAKTLYCVRNLPSTIYVILDRNGVQSGATEGDQPFTSDIPVLEYGTNWNNGGFNCNSEESGVLCSHQEFGAFRLSRKGLKKLPPQ